MADEENPEVSEEVEGKDLVKDLRQYGESQKERADRVERELVFIKAGIDTSKGVGKLTFENYKGEATTEAALEAVEDTAIAYGFSLESKDPEPEPEAEGDPVKDQSRQEQADIRQRVNQSQSADPGSKPDPDPITTGLAEFQARMAEGMTAEDASQELFGRMIDAAANGDERVLYRG
jgi:hypothetical protein